MVLNKDKRENYDRNAVNVMLGRAGYKPARKSRYSKSAKDKWGVAPEFM
jgi:hypothetical protein